LEFDMPTLDQLAKKAKTAIKMGDGAAQTAEYAFVTAEEHYFRAGEFLLEAKAHRDMTHGHWLKYLKQHGIVERTARQHMALASGKATLAQIREAARDRMRLAREVKSAEQPECSADMEPAAALATTAVAPIKVPDLPRALPAQAPATRAVRVETSSRTISLAAPAKVLADVEARTTFTPLIAPVTPTAAAAPVEKALDFKGELGKFGELFQDLINAPVEAPADRPGYVFEDRPPLAVLLGWLHASLNDPNVDVAAAVDFYGPAKIRELVTVLNRALAELSAAKSAAKAKAAETAVSAKPAASAPSALPDFPDLPDCINRKLH
jgi:hypothetical protein